MGQQAPPSPTRHTWSVFSREAITAPFRWVCLWEADLPGLRVLPLLTPRGETPSAWGLFCSPWGREELGLASAAAARGPGRRGADAAMWALLSSPGFKDVQTNSVPVPGSASSLLEAPAGAPCPPSCSYLESQWCLSPPTPGHAEEGEALPGGGKAGAGMLTCSLSHHGPGRELDAHSHALSDHRRTFQPRAVLCAMATCGPGSAASPKGDVPEGKMYAGLLRPNVNKSL